MPAHAGFDFGAGMVLQRIRKLPTEMRSLPVKGRSSARPAQVIDPEETVMRQKGGQLLIFPNRRNCGAISECEPTVEERKYKKQ